MRKCILFLMLGVSAAVAQGSTSWNPTHAFAIAAPSAARVDDFVKFMEEELGPNGINTLILRVDFNYRYRSYPQLRDKNALSKQQVKQLVEAARRQQIELIPQINLLGHQSWAGTTHALLREFPAFDETPHVVMPEEYVWPNEDSLYCKSYCSLHPKVHEVVFALVDEIMEVFEARAFHAGMDEVFYIGDAHCPRCGGQDKAKLFADEVRRIRNHLSSRDQTLWIWGDRLLDGRTTGMGMWEASENGTAAAIDHIPQDVVVCDWHYNEAIASPAYFAIKGFDVVSCFWNKRDVAIAHMQMMEELRSNSNETMRSRFRGTMQTVWSPAGRFLDAYYGDSMDESALAQVASFRAMVSYLRGAVITAD
ncbi:glycoside hydrolase [Reichenbachiella sp. 5M10]|uniref:family 20 glycosylhydrolase n=1 Tax=Reichenbachiella sp. 5M10 TaxID=1889772 RepID=UPI000C51BFE9|nr:family 20 glycosylhydrolase [Reichenbachiella sp. 5M10]PIB37504.1 glycoside hydrolase [Reichenbachiella sp. 5M10]